MRKTKKKQKIKRIKWKLQRKRYNATRVKFEVKQKYFTPFIGLQLVYTLKVYIFCEKGEWNSY